MPVGLPESLRVFAACKSPVHHLPGKAHSTACPPLMPHNQQPLQVQHPAAADDAKFVLLHTF